MALAVACQTGEILDMPVDEQIPIFLSGDINQLAVTRASDNGFASGDQVGVWAVNYEGDTPGQLTLKDNQATNVRFTFNGSTWASDYDIYYKDKDTKVDIFGIYPYNSAISSIEAQPFEVREDQSTVSAHGTMGGYEASDFLWAKREAVMPSPSTVQLLFQHKMSCVVVTLEEGIGFAAGEFASLSQSVLINNVKRNATINLATGEVTATGAVPARSTVPAEYEGGFRAIVVPQTVSSASSLFSITLGGVSYTYSEGSAFTYVPGKQHSFNVTVDKKADGGYNVTVQTTISTWTNDNSSHEFVAKEYVVVNVETPGTLGETLTAAGKNPAAIKYLKVLGTVNADDFYYMRDNMAVLQGVNMQMTKVVENTIPDNAFSGKASIRTFVFPDGQHNNTITRISGFDNTSLSGTLIIPEGVESIGGFAHTKITSISFPSTLVKIEDNAFEYCSLLTSTLCFNDGLKSIGLGSFQYSAISGSLYLPDSIENIDQYAFYVCSHLSGSLYIPSRVTKINSYSFGMCGFNGHLSLPNGVSSIGDWAFWNVPFTGELFLPSSLLSIGDYAFSGGRFTGELVFPEDLSSIGIAAFSSCGFTGMLVFPDGVLSIAESAFSYNSFIYGIELHKDISYIGPLAFNSCYGINSIICHSECPPTLGDGAFDGVAKDNFLVEVPESGLTEYIFAPGWSEFKRIGVYRNFSIGRRVYRTLNPEESRSFILRADSDASWHIEEQPSWVNVSPSSGTGKTDVIVTVNSLSTGSGNRTGEVVFLLDGKDYRSTLVVEQYDYAYGDGSVFTKQTHSKGNGIPIVFMGDCYDAADIASGSYLNDTEEAIGYFFDIEPYKTYKDYFDVYIVFGKSEDSGVGSANTIRESKFGTQYSFSGFTYENGSIDSIGSEVAFEYSSYANNGQRIKDGLVVIVVNSDDCNGITYLWPDNSAIAICSKGKDDNYPFDFRGIVQHEAGGHGFGKLADEYIYYNSFPDNYTIDAFNAGKTLGWYKNVSLGVKTITWQHLMYHPAYTNYVDIYEGAYEFARGFYRSEYNSCMNNDIPYYSAISRQAIVERIMDYAGVPFVLEEFYANDVRTVSTKASVDASPSWMPAPSNSLTHQHHHPIIMGYHPIIKE